MNRKKVKRSIRLEPYLFDMVRDVADTLFREPDMPEGNFSAAINYILKKFYTEDEFSKLLALLKCKAEFDRGVRSRKVIEGKKQLDLFMTKLALNGLLK